jgi:hypothetical protein
MVMDMTMVIVMMDRRLTVTGERSFIVTETVSATIKLKRIIATNLRKNRFSRYLHHK